MSLTALLIDDDPTFRELARRVLGTEGVNVVGEAASASEGLAAAESLRPEVVLVDIGLPDGDGIALARRLSALDWRPRVVLTSVYPEAASAAEVKASGAHVFASKDQLPGTGLRLLIGS